MMINGVINDDLIRKLILAKDYADADRLKTKYFWYLYGGKLLMSTDTEFDINIDADTLLNLGRMLKNKINND